MWAGDIDLQCPTVRVTDGHVELNVFEKTNDVVFSFTTSNLKVHFQRMAGTDSSTNHRLASNSILISRYVLCIEFDGLDFTDALFRCSDPFLGGFSQGSCVQKAKTKTAVDLRKRRKIRPITDDAQ